MVIYDQTLDCIVPTLGNDKDFNNNLILRPDKEYCDKKRIRPDRGLWRTIRCENQSTIVEDDNISVKNVETENQIYCYTLQIKLYENLGPIDCPNYAFLLPINQSFRIGRLYYRADQIKLKNEMTFDAGISQRVNFELMPKHKLDLTDDQKIVELMTDTINTESYQFIHGTPWITGGVSASTILIVGILMVISWLI